MFARSPFSCVLGVSRGDCADDGDVAGWRARGNILGNAAEARIVSLLIETSKFSDEVDNCVQRDLVFGASLCVGSLEH